MVRGSAAKKENEKVRDWGYFSRYNAGDSFENDAELLEMHHQKVVTGFNAKVLNSVMCEIKHYGGRPPTWCQK